MEYPAWLRRATRIAYADPQRVGWAAWWEFLGDVVAFEHLDGRIVSEWGDEEIS